MNNKFKFIIAAMLLFSMVACNGGNNSSSNSSTESSLSSNSSSSNFESSSSKVEYEEVTYTFNASTDLDFTNDGTAQEDIIINNFTIVKGTSYRFREKKWTNPDNSSDVMNFTRSVKFGSKSDKMNIFVPGNGTLSVWVQNGSSNAETQSLSLTGPDGKVDYTFDGKNSGNPVVKLDFNVKEGTYSITRPNSTFDLFYATLTCTVEKSNESGFDIVSKGKIDYLEGEAFDASNIRLNIKYENGKLEPLAINNENVVIDSYNFNSSIPGTYPISIKYKNYETITYNVTVYEVESMHLGRDAIEKLSKNTSSNNGVYFNHSLKEVYALNEELNLKGLSVQINASYDGKSISRLIETGYEITGFDSTSLGEKTITVKYLYNNKSIEKSFMVYVVDTAPERGTDGTVKIKVNPSYNGNIGAASEGYNNFNTIQQALDYLSSRKDINSEEKKVIELAEGRYEEKLEITIPNLTIIGNDAENTIIEWDSIYGELDESGFSHVTDSTQTVAVREDAINCYIDGVTISNFFNSHESFVERGRDIERALALLVQADQFKMTNSKLLGVQDTLELFKGRQYFENVFISGYTDFIFGTNNTTYFKDCEIHTIYTNKVDKGTTGYLTAFKGCNNGASDYVKYGAIFDGCNFSADEKVTDGLIAIGRTWGAYAAVSIINSTLGKHINTSSDRYISMNGILPTDETVQFTEYNNTGEGAISSEISGMTMLSDEEAKNYSDFEVIFGTTNGKVTYTNPWDPTSNEIIKDKNIYYYFNGNSSPTGTSYTYDQQLNGQTGTFGDIAIDATKGKVVARDSDTQINAGGKLTFDVKAKSNVIVTTHANYTDYTLNGVGTTSGTFARYYENDTTVVFEALGTVYLHSIIIVPEQEAPDAASLIDLHVFNETKTFNVGDPFTYEGLIVKAEYSDFSLITLDSSDYTVELDNEPTTAGKYTATVTYNSKTYTYEVEYVGANEDPTIISKTTIINLGEYNGQTVQGNVVTWDKLTIDATANDAKFASNGDNTWVQVNANTVITFKVAEDAQVTLETYQNSTSYTITVEDGIVTIVATSQIYIGKINVVIPTVFKEATTIDLTQDTIHIEGSTGTHKGLDIDATNGKFKDNGSGWIQVNANTVITFKVAEGAQVTLETYQNSTSYTITIEDGLVTITFTGQVYLASITITY